MYRIAFFIAVIFALSLGSARADANSDFHDATNDAYAGYRAATSYLRTGNPGLASLELAAALDIWRDVIAVYATTRPPAYANDQAFSATLNDIAQKLEAALITAESGNSKQAAKLLRPVRGMLYDLRFRNGARLYADCITELNRAVEPLYKFRHAPPDLGNADVGAQLLADSRTYEALLVDCRGMAPTRYTADPEFIRLFDGTLKSVQSMYPAIDSGEPGRVVNILRELRSFDRIIYFRFGG